MECCHADWLLVVRYSPALYGQYCANLFSSYSLKNHGVDEEVNKMFDMGVEMMDLPLEEKIKYDKGAETGVSAG